MCPPLVSAYAGEAVGLSKVPLGEVGQEREEMSHDTERANAVNLRAQVAILRSQLAKSQARECQMQGILERVMVDRYWQQRIAFAKRGMGTAVEYGKLPLDIESTLTSSSGSCPHATRLAELEADAALDKAELSRIRPKRGDPYFHSTVEEWAAECRQTADLRADLATARKLCDKTADEMLAMSEPDHEPHCKVCGELYRELRAEGAKGER